MVLNAPGVVKTVVADGEDLVILNNYRANMAFDRNALVLGARVPAMPEGGDAADDVMTVTDPISGLSFQVAMYRQYRRTAFEVGIVYGTKAVKSAHMALLLG